MAEEVPSKPPDPQPSYATAVGLASSSSAKPLIPLTTYKGEPAVVVPEDDIKDSLAGFMFALIGKFPIFPKIVRPNMDRIRLFFARLNLKAAYEVGSLDLGHILIRLSSTEDYQRLWARETWEIDRVQMRVFKWSMDFASHKESAIVPAWILLPGLPPNLFKQHILFSIVQAVGKPLRMDQATSSISRPSVARVCVEVDLLLPNPSRIWIAIGDKNSGFWQKVEYEYLPKYCSEYFRLGHENSECQGVMMPPLTLQHSHKQPLHSQEQHQQKKGPNVQMRFQNHDMVVSRVRDAGKKYQREENNNSGAKDVWVQKDKGRSNPHSVVDMNPTREGNATQPRISEEGRTSVQKIIRNSSTEFSKEKSKNSEGATITIANVFSTLHFLGDDDYDKIEAGVISNAEENITEHPAKAGESPIIINGKEINVADNQLTQPILHRSCCLDQSPFQQSSEIGAENVTPVHTHHLSLVDLNTNTEMPGEKTNKQVKLGRINTSEEKISTEMSGGTLNNVSLCTQKANTHVQACPNLQGILKLINSSAADPIPGDGDVEDVEDNSEEIAINPEKNTKDNPAGVEEMSINAEKYTEDSPVCVNGKKIIPWTGINCDEIDLTHNSSGLNARARGFLIQKPRSTFKIRRKPVHG